MHGEPIEITPLTLPVYMEHMNQLLREQEERHRRMSLNVRIDPLTGEDLDKRPPPRNPEWEQLISRALSKKVVEMPQWGDPITTGFRTERKGPLKVLSEWDGERVERFCEIGCILMQSRMTERLRKMNLEKNPDEIREMVLVALKEEALALTEHLVILALDSRILHPGNMKKKGEKKRRVIIDEEEGEE